MQTQRRIKDYTQSDSVCNVHTAEDHTNKMEIFESIDINIASLFTLFKQEDLIIIMKIETMLLVAINGNFLMWM